MTICIESYTYFSSLPVEYRPAGLACLEEMVLFL